MWCKANTFGAAKVINLPAKFRLLDTPVSPFVFSRFDFASVVDDFEPGQIHGQLWRPKQQSD